MARSKGSQNSIFGKSLEGYISLSKGGGGKYRATLSRELTNLGNANKQICFSLGIDIHPQNLGEAIQIVNLIEKSILEDLEKQNLDKTFEKYKPKKLVYNSNLKTFRYYLDNYKDEYFTTRASTNQSKHTFRKVLQTLMRNYKDYLDETFSIEIVKKIILNKKNTNSYRNDLVTINKVFIASFSELKNYLKINDINLGDYRVKNTTRPIQIPSDEKIIFCGYKLACAEKSKGKYENVAESWFWIYGVIAIYGLRPHEMLAIDYEKSFEPPNYILYLDSTLCDGTKRGDRTIPPLIPLNEFAIMNVFNILKVKESVEEKEKLVTCLQNRTVRGTTTFAGLLSQRFLAKEIGFIPYALRHAYAIRGHKMGIPIQAMAKYMGHSIEIHESTYQKYMSDEDKLEPYRNAMIAYEKIKQIEKGKISYSNLEAELIQVKKQLEFSQEEVEKLKTEILMLKSLQCQLSEFK